MTLTLQSYDIIGHVTLRFPISHFVFASSGRFSVATIANVDVTTEDRRQTDTTLQHKCSISATNSTVR